MDAIMRLWKGRKDTPPAHYHIVLIAQVPGTLSCTMGCVRNIETGEPLRIETLDEALEIMAWHADNGRQGYIEVCG